MERRVNKTFVKWTTYGILALVAASMVAVDLLSVVAVE